MHTCSISLPETQRTTHSRIVYAQAATVRYEMDAATATPLVSWDSFVAYEKVSFPSTTGEVSGLELTSAALLQAQGYTTGFVGKWHLTPPWEDYPEMKRFKKSVSRLTTLSRHVTPFLLRICPRTLVGCFRPAL